MRVNLGSILRATAGLRGDHVVIRFGDRAVTYDELDRAASGIAASLRARGLAPGDNVALMVPNVPEFTMAYFGILYAGCTVVPINVLLSGEEVQYHLEDSEAKLLVAHSFFRATADQGAGAAGVPVVWTEGEAARAAAAGRRRRAGVAPPSPPAIGCRLIRLGTSGSETSATRRSTWPGGGGR